ncbi:hypothetical protein KJ656_06905, partial [bacterium]|nr:hypothetical protein [bacterium]
NSKLQFSMTKTASSVHNREHVWYFGFGHCYFGPTFMRMFVFLHLSGLEDFAASGSRIRLNLTGVFTALFITIRSENLTEQEHHIIFSRQDHFIF